MTLEELRAEERPFGATSGVQARPGAAELVNLDLPVLKGARLTRSARSTTDTTSCTRFSDQELHDTLCSDRSRPLKNRPGGAGLACRSTNRTSSGAQAAACGPRWAAPASLRDAVSDREGDPRRQVLAAAGRCRRGAERAGTLGWWRAADAAAGCRREFGADVVLSVGRHRAGPRAGWKRSIRSSICYPLIVIVLPPYGVSTAEAYAWYDEDRGRAARATSAPDAARALADSRRADDQRPRAAGRAAAPRESDALKALLREAGAVGGRDVGQRVGRVRAVPHAGRRAARSSRSRAKGRGLVTRTLSRAEHERRAPRLPLSRVRYKLTLLRTGPRGAPEETRAAPLPRRERSAQRAPSV